MDLDCPCSKATKRLCRALLEKSRGELAVRDEQFEEAGCLSVSLGVTNLSPVSPAGRGCARAGCPSHSRRAAATVTERLEILDGALSTGGQGNRAPLNQVEEGPLVAIALVVGRSTIDGPMVPEDGPASVGPSRHLIAVELLLVFDSVHARSYGPLGHDDRTGKLSVTRRIAADLREHVLLVALKREGACAKIMWKCAR